jgi:hypothetical protein
MADRLRRAVVHDDRLVDGVPKRDDGVEALAEEGSAVEARDDDRDA